MREQTESLAVCNALLYVCLAELLEPGLGPQVNERRHLARGNQEFKCLGCLSMGLHS